MNLARPSGRAFLKEETMTGKAASPKVRPSDLFYLGLAFSLVLSIAGVLMSDGFFDSYKLILTNPAILLTDFSYVGGIGATFLNAGLMGLLASFMVFLASDYRGFAFSATLMCIGFSFFGKTPLTGAVILAGTILRNLVTRRAPFADIANSLFGTCMGPMISFIAFAIPGGWPLAILAGLIAGFVLPETASLTKRAYKNMNLYNIAFASTVITAIAAGIIRGTGTNLDTISGPYLEYPSWGYVAVLVAFLIIGAIALLFIKGSKEGFQAITACKCDGADYLATGGTGGALLNFSISGVILVLVPWLALNAPFTGPLLGTIIAVAGWTVTAKKPTAMLTLMAGYVLAFFVSSYSLSPAIAMGALFVTGLCPLSDRLGPLYGLLAGFLHLFVVTKCSAIHGGLMLYNNGLSAAIVAILIVALYKSLRAKKAEEL